MIKMIVMRGFEWGRDLSFGSGQEINVPTRDLARALMKLGYAAPADDAAVAALRDTYQAPARAGRSMAGAWY